MSHDDANMDCSQALYRMMEYVDGEMTPEDTQALREHLSGCAPCLAERDIDRVLRQIVQRSCACEPAPRGCGRRSCSASRRSATTARGPRSRRCGTSPRAEPFETAAPSRRLLRNLLRERASRLTPCASSSPVELGTSAPTPSSNSESPRVWWTV
uniref:Zf-HC2 domain-containing protein n=1 Tax=Janibacter limosus TaxID=53458 RepID=A0AC61U6G2_9MICO|nr:zf-HC2 domain-containing protein [Janibacter limosus]